MEIVVAGLLAAGLFAAWVLLRGLLAAPRGWRAWHASRRPRARPR